MNWLLENESIIQTGYDRNRGRNQTESAQGVGSDNCDSSLTMANIIILIFWYILCLNKTIIIFILRVQYLSYRSVKVMPSQLQYKYYNTYRICFKNCQKPMKTIGVIDSWLPFDVWDNSQTHKTNDWYINVKNNRVILK